MSESVARKLQNIINILSLCSAIGFGGGFYYLTQFRIGAAEEDIKGLKQSRESDHALLFRIDERTQMIHAELRRLNPPGK